MLYVLLYHTDIPYDAYDHSVVAVFDDLSEAMIWADNETDNDEYDWFMYPDSNLICERFIDKGKYEYYSWEIEAVEYFKS